MDGASVRVVELTPVRRRIEVDIPAGQVTAELDRAFALVGRQARLPGFRPGRAPRHVLERAFGESVRRDVLGRLVEEAFREAIAEHRLAVVGAPEIDADVPVAGEPFRFTATVDVRPEIVVGDVGAIEVERPSAEVTEADVDAALTSLRESAAHLKPVARDVVEAGDVVTVNVVSRLPGAEPVSREGVHLEAGGGSFPLALERQLVGQRRGARLTLEVPYPADYPGQGLMGKTATFDVELLDVREKELPVLDDDFARDHGHCDTLDALRERIREDLGRRASERAEQAVRQGILSQLLERVRFDVPPSLVASRIDAMIQSLDLRVPGGADRDEALGGLRAQLAPGAERDVRAELLLDAVAGQRGIEVDDGAMDAEIDAVAARHGEAPDRVRALYERPEARAVLRSRLRRERAMQSLIANAKIVPSAGSAEVAHEMGSR